MVSLAKCDSSLTEVGYCALVATGRRGLSDDRSSRKTRAAAIPNEMSHGPIRSQGLLGRIQQNIHDYCLFFYREAPARSSLQATLYFCLRCRSR